MIEAGERLDRGQAESVGPSSRSFAVARATSVHLRSSSSSLQMIQSVSRFRPALVRPAHSSSTQGVRQILLIDERARPVDPAFRNRCRSKNARSQTQSNLDAVILAPALRGSGSLNTFFTGWIVSPEGSIESRVPEPAAHASVLGDPGVALQRPQAVLDALLLDDEHSVLDVLKADLIAQLLNLRHDVELPAHGGRVLASPPRATGSPR